MSVTHLRLGRSAVKSRSSLFGAGCLAGSAWVVVGLKALRNPAFQAHFPHRRATVLRQAVSNSSRCCSYFGDLWAAVDAVRLGVHLPNRC